MEKLQQFLNLRDSDGSVITFCDGKFTLSQIIIFVVAVLAVSIVLSLLKNLIGIIVSVAITAFLLVNLNIMSPTQLQDVSSIVAKSGVEAYQKVAEASDNIKIKDSTILIKVDDSWIDLSDVDSVVSTAGDKLTIIADGQTYLTDDNNIINLLKQFQ
jgi:hypothetical protein